MKIGNLFADAAPPEKGERFDTLLSHDGLVLQRIVSSADMHPSEYIQREDEWVVLLEGRATLEVAGETVVLAAGDHIFLPAGTPHTVKGVSEGAIWLALHVAPDAAKGAPDR